MHSKTTPPNMLGKLCTPIADTVHAINGLEIAGVTVARFRELATEGLLHWIDVDSVPEDLICSPKRSADAPSLCALSVGMQN